MKRFTNITTKVSKSILVPLFIGFFSFSQANVHTTPLQQDMLQTLVSLSDAVDQTYAPKVWKNSFLNWKFKPRVSNSS